MAFRGQYDCTMDDKGRIKMPSALHKQFSAEDGNRFMIARDIEECLVIYPMETWKQEEAKLKKLNLNNTDHRRYMNAITAGLTEVELDSADRFLVSKTLMKFLGNAKEIVMLGMLDRIQVWDEKKFTPYNQENVANIGQLSNIIGAYLEEKDKNGA